MKMVVLGLTISSTWGNGHATTYRCLLKALHDRGHDVLFLERDKDWYRPHRDEPDPEGVDLRLYDSLEELESYRDDVRDADVVVVGSYVPDGKRVADWALRTAQGTRAFYDIDTPLTMESLRDGTCPYVDPDLLRGFDVVFSFSAGSVLGRLENEFGARRAVALPCSVDPERYAPKAAEELYALGYMGTYSDDRQPVVERLLNVPARALPDQRFAVAGPSYPDLDWPENVELLGNLPQSRHPDFYAQQRFTLNVTRQAMVASGHSPSVRLFEAAASGTPIISDRWDGMEAFFRPGEEIIIADGPEDVLQALRMREEQRQALARRARQRVLEHHTAAHRAREFEQAVGRLVDA